MSRTVLFLCTGNSARSQMAEALTRRLRPEGWQAYSAGSHPTGQVHPLAIAALREVGIELEGARSKSLEEFRDQPFDLVITVCDDAAQECPVWLGQGARVHLGFPDPAGGTIDDFRRVRDAIREQVLPFLDTWAEEHRG